MWAKCVCYASILNWVGWKDSQQHELLRAWEKQGTKRHNDTRIHFDFFFVHFSSSFIWAKMELYTHVHHFVAISGTNRIEKPAFWEHRQEKTKGNEHLSFVSKFFERNGNELTLTKINYFQDFVMTFFSTSRIDFRWNISRGLYLAMHCVANCDSYMNEKFIRTRTNSETLQWKTNICWK